jgi:hypothetical protein
MALKMPKGNKIYPNFQFKGLQKYTKIVFLVYKRAICATLLLNTSICFNKSRVD